jgi:TolB protein
MFDIPFTLLLPREQSDWSPNHSKLALMSRLLPHKLFVMDAAGGNLRPVTSGPGDDWFIQWSPDSSRILFRRNDRPGEFYVASTTEDSTVQFAAVSPAYGPVWAPNGQQIAFEAHGDIYVVDADGSDHRNVTSTPNTIESGPFWSADGSKILYRKMLMTSSPGEYLFVMNVDGSEQRQFSLLPGPHSAPQWSASGRKLVFIKLYEDAARHNSNPAIVDHSALTTDIGMMDADGSNERRLTFGLEPSWFACSR